MADIDEELQARLTSAIEEVFRDVEGGIVTKWVLIAETVGPDGERGLWAKGSDDLRAWEAIGMLQASLLLEQRRWGAPNEDDA